DSPIYVRSAWLGTGDLLHDQLIVEGSAIADKLEVEMTGPAATVEGTIPPAEPDSPPMVAVVLLRRVENEMLLEKEFFINSSLPPDARMSVNRLPPMQGGTRFTMQGVAP